MELQEVNMERKVLRNLSYGVYIVGSKNETKNVGCTINSAVQITSDTIAISIHHDNYTNECIKNHRKFSLSILKETSNPEIIGTFGYSSSKDQDKFEKYDMDYIDNLPVIKDNCGVITSEVINEVETETHTIFIGKILHTDHYTNESPMTYRYYHNVLKGKSPKNAPTYEKDEKKGWKCPICGYVYEGESIPEDYRCPICGVEGSLFKIVD